MVVGRSCEELWALVGECSADLIRDQARYPGHALYIDHSGLSLSDLGCELCLEVGWDLPAEHDEIEHGDVEVPEEVIESVCGGGAEAPCPQDLLGTVEDGPALADEQDLWREGAAASTPQRERQPDPCQPASTQVT